MENHDELASQIADLALVTTNLTDEVVGQKDRLTTAANTATAKATQASADASAAAASATQASAISGLDTVADAVDLELDQRGYGLSNSGRNKVFVDAQGNTNEMVMIPAFKCEDINAAILERYGVDMQLGAGLHPAFLTGGFARKYLWVGKYQASAGEGGTCSVVPNVQPSTSVNFDAAKSRCESKGTGWHLMSAHEWAAAALWSLANGTIPRGNTNHGRSHEEYHETAVRSDLLAPGDSGGAGRSNVGTGPATWAHDHSDFGIHDLVGNVWEWVDQFKMVDGQIITTADNDPSLLEADWLAQSAYFDAVNGIELSDSVTVTGTPNKMIADVGQSATYTPNLLLRQMLVEFSAKPLDVGRLHANNEGERFPRRGGGWNSGSDAGLGTIYLDNERTVAHYGIGFRPAFFG